MSNSELSSRARAALPGGVSHELRYRAPHPVFIERASGAEKWDAEGRRYIDFKMGSASQMLGHGHPAVVEALQRQADQAIFSADCHAAETEWAEWVNRLFPCAERTRFTASGSEATMLAMRLGRAWSGKDRVLRVDGHYHGWHDHALKGAKAGSLQAASLGVPDAVNGLVEVCAADPQAMQAALQDNSIGTVIIEASGANYGSVPLSVETLRALHDAARAAGAVLIFDEIITGLRWSPGGRQARDSIVPDLTTLAKVVTGGLPGGAVCGRADLMELMNNAAARDGLSPPVSHKGTFNGSPLIAAAACAAMPLLATGEVQAQADAMAERLRDGLNARMARHGIVGCAYGESSTCHLLFGAANPEGLSPAAIRNVPPALVAGLRCGLLARGVDLMSHTSCVTSAAHTPELIDEALDAFDAVFAALVQDGVLQ
ncbi:MULTISPECIES: aspartate aminotransferase family protein [unclassified Leisingera]|uniref:aspartate aminotransferase family protein n=1 Tax=unclassified Leisingera TaxID=2614906 RepID=UPI0003109FB9|nr:MULTISPECIES: aminotransferase class III-fold pyridoxal phosphate-dependent enzyme [unclassified Leisingera]KIC26890.1 glutamate-1-semialdehyde 2,1-aminomutase [Leisingera sp. ANG-S3]KIC50588.1 glutamate-1-semialdehyde 2,1-aminomutase [Leisingera sp. ANG-S]KID07043.1 glutamate-1-semialdehyde 2,1-aminomutase [Leisingera sp. ANG1]